MHEQRAPVRKQYDRWAPIYDVLWRGYIARTLSALSAWAPIEPHSRILDVGCGTGAIVELLLEEGTSFQQYTGVDLSEEMLGAARRKHETTENVRFVRANAEALPFPDGTFDIIVSSSALHYFRDPESALTEMGRVARPGGHVVLLDWCTDFLAMRVLDAILQRVDPAHHRCYSLEEFHQLLERAGLGPVRSKRFRADWFWGMMIVSAVRETE